MGHGIGFSEVRGGGLGDELALAELILGLEWRQMALSGSCSSDSGPSNVLTGLSQYSIVYLGCARNNVIYQHATCRNPSTGHRQHHAACCCTNVAVRASDEITFFKRLTCPGICCCSGCCAFYKHSRTFRSSCLRKRGEMRPMVALSRSNCERRRRR
jgi:hypothetical protein